MLFWTILRFKALGVELPYPHSTLQELVLGKNRASGEREGWDAMVSKDRLPPFQPREPTRLRRAAVIKQIQPQRLARRPEGWHLLHCGQQKQPLTAGFYTGICLYINFLLTPKVFLRKITAWFNIFRIPRDIRYAAWPQTTASSSEETNRCTHHHNAGIPTGYHSIERTISIHWEVLQHAFKTDRPHTFPL